MRHAESSIDYFQCIDKAIAEGNEDDLGFAVRYAFMNSEPNDDGQLEQWKKAVDLIERKRGRPLAVKTLSLIQREGHAYTILGKWASQTLFDYLVHDIDQAVDSGDPGKPYDAHIAFLTGCVWSYKGDQCTAWERVIGKVATKLGRDEAFSMVSGVKVMAPEKSPLESLANKLMDKLDKGEDITPPAREMTFFPCGVRPTNQYARNAL